MERLEASAKSMPSARDDEVEYLFDMIAQLAKLAKQIGELDTAVFLEAIITARRVGVQRTA